MSCACNDKQQECNKKEPVPFWAHEADMARLERTNSRLTVLSIFLAVVCAALGALLYFSHIKSEKALNENNEMWIEMWKEYDFESYEYQQDGEGVNIIGDGNGVDYNGTENKGKAQN